MEQNFENLRIINGSELVFTDVEWLWYPYIPFGKLTIIQGDPGEGKSTFVLNLAAMLSKGEPLPFSENRHEPMNIIYQNTEDDPEDTVGPRFVNAGGDINRIFFIDERKQALSFTDGRIGEAIRRTGAKLIIFDPLASYIGKDANINLANEVRERMNYLIDVAKETGCAVIIVGHLNKMSGTKAVYRSNGSIDIVASARSCLLIGSSAEDPTKRIMAVQKANLAEKGKAIEFDFDKSKVNFIRQLDMSADELVNAFAPGSRRKGEKLERAKEIISEMLSDGPKTQRDVMQRVNNESISSRTADEAKKEMGVISTKLANMWVWSLPDDV